MIKALHKLEKVVDKSIPYALIVLLGVIIISFFFHDYYEQHKHTIHLIDQIIIGIFVADLVFKFIRVRKIKEFIKLYWLDIIVIFPFYLVLRLFEELFLLLRFSETVKEGQSLAHVGVELRGASAAEKEGARIIREAEKLGKASRSSFAVRFFRPISRIPRLVKVLPYYEHTTGDHHLHDPEKKKTKRKSR